MSMEIMTIQNVRAYIDAQGTAWLNAEDVARGLGFVHNETKNGVEYSTIRWSTVNNYLQEFGFANKVAKDSFIPENMFYRLAMKASNAAAEKFQALVADEILPTLRKTGTYSIVTPAPVADMVRDVRITAEEIQTLFIGVKRGIALSQAIDLVGSFQNFDLGNLKMLLAPAEHDTGYMNATKIGEKLKFGKGKKAGCKANILLEKAGLQRRDGDLWRLTLAGSHYGEEMPYTRNGHSGYQIRWNENVIDFLKTIIIAA